MDPQVVFATLKSLGGSPRRVLIVGCEPLDIDDGIGLSEPVGRAVEEAVRLVHSVVDDLAARPRVARGRWQTQLGYRRVKRFRAIQERRSRNGGTMHEYGMCDGIVDAVQRRAAGRRVARVKVRVGVMHRIVEEAFHHAFAHAAEGTEAGDAAIDIVVVPVKVVCRSCGATFDSEDLAIACASCSGVDLDLAGGDELVLESIEYDADEQ